MKVTKILAFLIFTASFQISYGQKKTISNQRDPNWSVVFEPAISNSGEYILYQHVSNSGRSGGMLYKIDDGVEIKIDDGRGAKFVGNGQYVFYQGKNTANLIELKSNSRFVMRDVDRAEFFMVGGMPKIFGYDGIKGAVLDVKTRFLKNIGELSQYWPHEESGKLAFKNKSGVWSYDFSKGTSRLITKNNQTTEIKFNCAGSSMSFVLQDKDGPKLMVYNFKNNQLTTLIADNFGIKKGYHLKNQTPFFTNDGKNVVFRIAEDIKKESVDTGTYSKGLEIWSYKDAKVYPLQQYDLPSVAEKSYSTIINTATRKVIYLEDSEHQLAAEIGAKFAVLRTIKNKDESYWNYSQVPKLIVVDIATGIRKEYDDLIDPQFSPKENYLSGFGNSHKKYHMIDLRTGIGFDHELKTEENIRFGGWENNENSFILHDKYDVFQCKPNDANFICLTDAYGNKTKVRLEVCENWFKEQGQTFGKNILVAAFDNRSKSNGFCIITPGRVNKIDHLRLDSCLYYFPSVFVGSPNGPQKAKNADAYVFMEQRADSSPNVVFTKDFLNYKKVSNVHPENDYNWLKAELHEWTDVKGLSHQGLLYKPENFDPTKKYPLIYNSYEDRSNELHCFLYPDVSGAQLSIPWYASNGYLVFVPDIYFREGKFAEDMSSIIESSYKYLKKFSWVDAKKVGIQGHSFGGYTVNTIITRLPIFAAAQSTAGLSDMVVEFAGTGFDGRSLISMVEKGQLKLGATPWASSDRYIDNSATYMLDKVSTPLMIVHNRGDSVVPFQQSEMLFYGLRRLQKPVWLLQYDGNDHIVGDDDVVDYTIRQQQFFDHYLKNKPAPLWMLDSFPAKYKGMRSGLALDTLNRTP